MAKKCFAVYSPDPLDQEQQQVLFNGLFKGWKLHAQFNGATQFVIYADSGPVDSKNDVVGGKRNGISYMVKPYGYWG